MRWSVFSLCFSFYHHAYISKSDSEPQDFFSIHTIYISFVLCHAPVLLYKEKWELYKAITGLYRLLWKLGFILSVAQPVLDLGPVLRNETQVFYCPILVGISEIALHPPIQIWQLLDSKITMVMSTELKSRLQNGISQTCGWHSMSTLIYELVSIFLRLLKYH